MQRISSRFSLLRFRNSSRNPFDDCAVAEIIFISFKEHTGDGSSSDRYVVEGFFLQSSLFGFLQPFTVSHTHTHTSFYIITRLC